MIKLFLLFFLSISAHAYGPQDIKLSNYEFNRYVRPQLISITQDFQTLVISLNPELKSLKPITKILSNIKTRSQKLNNLFTAKKFDECDQNLSYSLKELRTGLLLLENFPSLIDKEFFTADNLLDSLHNFQVFKQSFFDLYVEYETYQFLLKARTGLTQPFRDLVNKVHFAQNTFQTYILSASDNRFRTEFISFWSDFIRPVKNIILPQNDKALFIHKLNDLNLRLNILNVVLTKRNKSITKQTSTILKIFHNRWNNILKVTLKR
ncbi:MAG: hypothetical protein ACJAS4_002117 [Bacteriovoracaceae bacterium]|jgi:hypothetical protein